MRCSLQEVSKYCVMILSLLYPCLTNIVTYNLYEAMNRSVSEREQGGNEGMGHSGGTADRHSC